MSDENLGAVIVGGVIGIVGGLAGTIHDHYLKRKAERESLQGAIISEIAAIVDIVERRNYADGIQKLIQLAEATPAPAHVPAVFYFSVRRNPFQVYDANLSKIGSLPAPMAGKIVQFYIMSSSILEDIADMKERTIPRSREDSIRGLKTLLQLFKDTVALGKQLIAEAEKR